MSGELPLAASPIGRLDIPPRLQAQTTSLWKAGENEAVVRMTRLRPGESVSVVATPGEKLFVNSPPGSIVGIESCRYRPVIESFGPTLWSILTISCRALKTPRSGTDKLLLSVGAGSFEKIFPM